MIRKRIFLIPLSLCLLPSMILADAGSTLRLYKDSTILAPSRQQPKEIQYEQQVENKQEIVIRPDKNTHAALINNIHVVGNTILSPEKLHKVLVPFIGRALTTDELHVAANNLMHEIREEGAFAAKVYILPQEIVDHTITFNVIEGHLAENGIVLGRSSERVDDDVIIEQLNHTLRPGSMLTSDKYERVIYLTNDLPGIKGSENLLFPATNIGEAGFKTIVEDQNLFTGNAYYDNFGSYYTGRNRWGGSLEMNSPTGQAEKITVGGNVSEYGTLFGFLDVNLLLYPNGLRGGVSLDYLDYKTDTNADLEGNALNGSVYLMYPVIRSRLHNLYTELHYTYTDLKDEVDTMTVTDRTLHVGSAKVYGDMSDSFFGGGITTARIEGHIGRVDLSDYNDAEYADTQGVFSRVTFNLTRLQHLIGDLQAYVAFNGQASSKHMDPSQAISFGGPYNFPGYHSGEVFGDKGWVIHTDLRYNIAPPWQGDLQLSVFYDYGWLETHTVAIVDGFPVPGAIDRSFHIQSVGIGLSQAWDNFSLQGVLGWQVGNEIPDELLDDGDDNDFQGWVHLVYSF